MNRRIGFALAVSGLAGAYFVSLAFAEEKEAQAQGNPFAEKVVTVYLTGRDADVGQVLENAELKEIGGRVMLVGISADTGEAENWTAGLPVGVAWDSVATYYLMTKEEFNKGLKDRGR